MDIGLIATSAVSLLVPYLVDLGKTLAGEIGKDVSDHVKGKVKVLYETIKNKFTGNEYASETLERLKEQPEAKGRQVAMASILQENLSDDPALQIMLDRLLTEIKQASGVSITQFGSGVIATDHGVAAGEGGYAAGGNIIINKMENNQSE